MADNEEDLRCVSAQGRIPDAVEAAYQEDFRHFLCGMALGCDRGIPPSASSACAETHLHVSGGGGRPMSLPQAAAGPAAAV